MPGVVYDYQGQPGESRECPVKNTEICYWIGEGKCSKCYLHTIKDLQTREGMLNHWRVMLSNLPEDIDDLGNSDTCVLCKGHEPNKTDCWAMTDLAHPDPPAKKGMIFGIGKKIPIPVGSMFTLHLAVCRDCRRKIRNIDLISILWFIGMIAVGMLLLMTPIMIPFGEGGILVGLGIVAACAVAGWFIGKACAKAYAKKVAGSVHIDLREIPQIGRMFRNRWFIYDGNRNTKATEFKLFFSNKKDFKNVFPPKDFAVDSEDSE